MYIVPLYPPAVYPHIFPRQRKPLRNFIILFQYKYGWLISFLLPVYFMCVRLGSSLGHFFQGQNVEKRNNSKCFQKILLWTFAFLSIVSERSLLCCSVLLYISRSSLRCCFVRSGLILILLQGQVSLQAYEHCREYHPWQLIWTNLKWNLKKRPRYEPPRPPPPPLLPWGYKNKRVITILFGSGFHFLGLILQSLIKENFTLIKFWNLGSSINIFSLTIHND